MKFATRKMSDFEDSCGIVCTEEMFALQDGTIHYSGGQAVIGRSVRSFERKFTGNLFEARDGWAEDEGYLFLHE